MTSIDNAAKSSATSTGGKRRGRGVALPFGMAAHSQMRFPQELSEDELGDSCPLCCPSCFSALRASRVDAADPLRGVKLAHRRSVAGCEGVGPRHMAAAYSHAAETCVDKFFWTPVQRTGDWEPHGSDAAGDAVEGTARLYKVAKALTGAAARRACGGAKRVNAVLDLRGTEDESLSRQVAVIFGDSATATETQIAVEASGGRVSVCLVPMLGVDELDPSFALGQVQDSILGNNGRGGARRWLWDERAAKPAEPAPATVPEEPEPEPPEPVQEAAAPRGGGIFGSLFRGKAGKRPEKQTARKGKEMPPQLYCGKCGSPLPAGAQACPNCGIPVAPSIATKDPDRHHTLKLVAAIFAGISFATVAISLVFSVLAMIPMLIALPSTGLDFGSVAATGYFGATMASTGISLVFCIAMFLVFGYMSLRCYKVYKGEAPNTWQFAVLTIFLCNIISGILLCIAEKDE